MNIFVLDKDPIISAQMQCDKHIVKMPLESAQMCVVYGIGMVQQIEYHTKKHTRTTHVHYGQVMMHIIMIGYGNMAWSYALSTLGGITIYTSVSLLSWT